MEETRNLSTLIIGALSICLPVFAYSYEVSTHARITRAIYDQSLLGRSTTLLEQQLGISQDMVLGDVKPSGAISYYDLFGSTVSERVASSFVLQKERIPILPVDSEENKRKSVTALGWLMRGAIREDDVCILGQLSISERCDAPNNMVRVTRHFYDPVNDRALTLLGVPLGEKAPNWGLGTTDFLANPPPENTARDNHFTIHDAKEAMYRAVTGQSTTGTTANLDDPRTAINSSEGIHYG